MKGDWLCVQCTGYKKESKSTEWGEKERLCYSRVRLPLLLMHGWGKICGLTCLISFILSVLPFFFGVVFPREQEKDSSQAHLVLEKGASNASCHRKRLSHYNSSGGISRREFCHIPIARVSRWSFFALSLYIQWKCPFISTSPFLLLP